MKYTGFEHYRTGVLIPVFSLKSEKSCACGEFLDLKELGDWCLAAGLDTIQLLPVNDTGDDASPYNALSAFALHPLYCRIEELPELAALAPADGKRIRAEVAKLRAAHADAPRVAYAVALEGKMAILRAVFELSRAGVEADKGFKAFRAANPWVEEYGAFRSLKASHARQGWQSWRAEYRSGGAAVVKKVWRDENLGATALFHAWLQYRLERQFLDSAEYLSGIGVMLKGDIPIMMNEDSADVWAHGANFQLDQRAGAPPDMFSRLGQNWGFPIYNWDYLEAHDYDWWRRRLRQADKFYQAYRIDHVLGFFRIWTIDRHHREGLLGYFRPSLYISGGELAAAGFDQGRINWLAEPHLPGWRLRELFGERADAVADRCLRRLGDEDLYLFKPEILGERSILELPLAAGEADILLDLYRDRSLVKVDEGLWSPAWTFRDCSRYRGLSDGEKASFEDLVARRGRESEELWQKNGEKLLRFMKETVPMLTCAEDLGVIPDCVPRVLGGLGILGLRIPRWARAWGEAGQPYIRLDDYPFLSVCAPSVHDTSTLRDWWENEGEREGFWRALGLSGPCPDRYLPQTAAKVLAKLLSCASSICMFQIQDLFALDPAYAAGDPKEERVNIPGTVQDRNWSYRMPMGVESLNANKQFADKIKELVEPRRNRALPQNI